jgi:hypothetical protein
MAIYALLIAVVLLVNFELNLRISFLAGLAVFLVSFLLKFLLVRRILNTSDENKKNSGSMLLVTLGGLPITGLLIWYCLVICGLTPISFAGGLVVGLMIFALCFHFLGQNEPIPSTR